MAKKKTQEIEKVTIADYLFCGFPAIAIESHEEGRLLAEIQAVRKLKGFEAFKIFTISATGRFLDVTDPSRWVEVSKKMPYGEAFAFIASKKDQILVAYDFQHMISNAVMYRALKDQFTALRQGSCVILVAPCWKLPKEMIHEIPVMDFALPTREQLGKALEVVMDSAHLPVLSHEERGACLDSASGLTLSEAENAFALSVSRVKRLDARLIADEKMKLIEAGGLLTVEPAPEVEVGGLGGLKEWFLTEVIPSKDNVLLRPKGLLMCGIPGTGKSLFGLKIGQLLNRPVLGCDVGSLKGGIVGESEGNITEALKMATAVSPCVLMLDEIEKGISGHESSGKSDGGTTLGMVGILLKWLQRQNSVFVVATCNDYSKLPSELTRPGRFDALFFVDLPEDNERLEIAEVMLEKYSLAPNSMELAIRVAEVTASWTGAEIEELVKSAARRTNQMVTIEAINAAAPNVKTIAKVKEGEIKEMRDWMKQSFRRANSAPVPSDIKLGNRRIRA